MEQSPEGGWQPQFHHHTLGQMAEQFQERARMSNENFVEPTHIDEGNDDDDDDEDGGEGGGQGAETTGRWSKEEHRLFLEALKKYGKEWKKVASMVKTRTVVQTRTHAQKYFQKISKALSSFPSPPASGEAADVPQPASSGQKSSSRKSKKSKDSMEIPSGWLAGQQIAGVAPVMDSARWAEVSPMPLVDHRGVVVSDDLVGVNLYSTPLPALRPPVPPPAFLPPMHDFPQPSPAACGKRKHAELTVAQMLASANMESDGAHLLLSSIKNRRASDLNDDTVPLSLQKPSLVASTPVDLSAAHIKAESGLVSADRQRLSGVTSAAGGGVGAVEFDTAGFLSQVTEAVNSGNPVILRDILTNAELSLKAYFRQTANDPEHKSSGGRDLSSLPSSIKLGGTIGSVALNSGSASGSHSGGGHRDEGVSSERKFSFTHLAHSLNRPTVSGFPIVIYTIMCPTIDEQVKVAMVQMLLEFGASSSVLDSYGNSSLHWAAKFNNVQLAETLLSYACPINIVNNDGDAAVHIAAKCGYMPFLQLLKKWGANFHLRNKAFRAALDIVGAASPSAAGPDAAPGTGAATGPAAATRKSLRQEVLRIEPRLRTLVLFHEDCMSHVSRNAVEWEGPDRLMTIVRKVKRHFSEESIEFSSHFDSVDIQWLTKIHSAEYISFVSGLAQQLRDQSATDDRALPFTPQVQKVIYRQSSEEVKKDENCDTTFSIATFTAALRAVGAVINAVDHVIMGRNRNAFCIVRPPGHHSGYNGLLNGSNSCGFCIFNSVAAGAIHALDERNVERVAIVDLDVHHGNGTEDIVRRYSSPSRLFFFSTHLFEKELVDNREYQFFPGSGVEDDLVHNVINVPLRPMWSHRHGSGKNGHDSHADSAIGEEAPSGRMAFRQAVEKRLLPALRAFNPQLILLSMGFDAADGDVGNRRNYPGGSQTHGMNLQKEDFAWMTTKILRVADICSNGRVVSVLEGGYGEYDFTKHSEPRANPPITRTTARTTTAATTTYDSAPPESDGVVKMNRDLLGNSALAHIERLLDPYEPEGDGPSSRT